MYNSHIRRNLKLRNKTAAKLKRLFFQNKFSPDLVKRRGQTINQQRLMDLEGFLALSSHSFHQLGLLTGCGSLRRCLTRPSLRCYGVLQGRPLPLRASPSQFLDSRVIRSELPTGCWEESSSPQLQSDSNHLKYCTKCVGIGSTVVQTPIAEWKTEILVFDRFTKC